MPNVLSPRDLVSRPDNMDKTVISSSVFKCKTKTKSFILVLLDFGHVTRFTNGSLYSQTLRNIYMVLSSKPIYRFS